MPPGIDPWLDLPVAAEPGLPTPQPEVHAAVGPVQVESVAPGGCHRFDLGRGRDGAEVGEELALAPLGQPAGGAQPQRQRAEQFHVATTHCAEGKQARKHNKGCQRHADLAGTDFGIGEVDYGDQGRSRVMGRNQGLVRIYGAPDGRLLGAEMCGPAVEHTGHLLAWALQVGMTVTDALRMPFYHPVVEEGIRTALRDLARALGLAGAPEIVKATI